MYESPKVLNLNHYAGTPENVMRMGFTMPDGNNRSALVRDVGDDWYVSVFVEEETETMFCVASNPSGAQLIVERWLAWHVPERRHYKTKAAQAKDLGAGNSAETMEHDEILAALQADLTKDDKPKPIQKPKLELEAVKEHKIKVVKEGRRQRFETTQEGEYTFREGKYGPVKEGEPDRTEPHWMCRLSRGPMAVRTKGTSTLKRNVFVNKQRTEMFFLFTLADGSYLLEALRETRTAHQRREATAAANAFPGTSPKKIVEAMAPDLLWDPDAFA